MTSSRRAKLRLRPVTGLAGGLLAALIARPDPAAAQTPGPIEEARAGIEALLASINLQIRQEELAALSLLFGILAFAVTVAILLVRTRRRLAEEIRLGAERTAELNARIDRAEVLLSAEQQALVVWMADSETPEIHSEPGRSKALPAREGDLLAFGKWLEPESALELETALALLRGRGESFNLMLRTRSGGHVEADGRTAGGRAVLRLRDMAGQRRELAEIYDGYKRLMRESETFRTLLEALPAPVWLADADGRTTWTNTAYRRALGETASGAGADSFLTVESQDSLAAARGQTGVAHIQMARSVDNVRRVFDLYEVATARCAGGIALDITDLERLSRELSRREDIHARTLNQISAGIAVFGQDRRLAFYNRAFREIWSLEDDFLSGAPGYGEILDRLRGAGRLPEQADYRDWRSRQLAIFDARSPQTADDQALWHLPDGRVLRAARNRQSDGGVACLFEDISAALDLEIRLVAATRVQRETLEALDEGIVVFGSNGRMRLHNPAFATIWKLSPEGLGGQPHVEEVIGWCRSLHDDHEVWEMLRGAVTGLTDSREPATARLERRDGSVIDMRVLPLPDGGTLVVFTDISASARMERALRDRNEALLAAARIKNEFVHKVSYELRAPLTNIIGFAQLMSDMPEAELGDRQREYTGYILSSSSALLAIINDILDLATIDAGVMELEIAQVDIRGTALAAAEALRDRSAEAAITLDIRIPEDIGAFEADEKRVRQILFNLLSNAIGFSETGQTVRLEARRPNPETVAFTVADEGRGIPKEVRDAVFERFESYSQGARYRGPGLGLSIVKSFVELHGGTVSLVSEPGRGTTVTCTFPAHHRTRGEADSMSMEPAAATVYTLPRRTPPANEPRPSGEGLGRHPV